MFIITSHGIDEATSALERYNLSRLSSRLRTAIRNTLRAGKQELKTRVQARYTAKNPMALGKTKTTASALRGSLKVGGSRNQLKKFIIKPSSRPRKMPPGGVFANVVRGQGGMIRRGFLQRSGGVFERVGRPRFPIRQLKTVSLPGMASRVGEHVEAKMAQRLGIEIPAALGEF